MSKFKDKEAFTRYNEEKKRDTFTVSVNADEREILNKSKLILEQSKDSTALKQLALIGAKVIHEPKVMTLLALIFKNKRNNERIGVADFVE